MRAPLVGGYASLALGGGAGFFCVVVLNMAWNANNARTSGHQGAGGGRDGIRALMQVLGRCGPPVGTRLYPRADGPWFTRGMGVCSAAKVVVAVLALGLRAYLAGVNRRLVREDENRVGVGEGGKSRYNGGFWYML